MVKKMLVCLFVLTIACTTMVFAAQKPVAVHANHIIQRKAVQDDSPASTVVLCSNVGPATNQYGANGYLVTGPASALGTSQFIAAPCTPKVSKILATVKGAWAYDGSGANQMQVCLYSDNGSNAPGTQIGKCVTKKNLPTFGTANTLVTATFTKQNLALTAGTQYWIVAQTPLTGTGDDFYGVWVGESVSLGYNVGQNGWNSFQPDLEGVMMVRGQ